MTDQPPLLLFRYSNNHSRYRLSPEITQILTKLLKHYIYNSTVPPSFETYPEDFYTIHRIREPYVSYLHYIGTYSSVETLDEPSFTNPFTPPLNSN